LFDLFPEIVDGSFCGFAEQRFEFCEELFYRVEVGRVGWKIEQSCTHILDGLPDPGDLVAAQVVEHHDVSRF